MSNPFQHRTGYHQLLSPRAIILVLASSVILSVLMSWKGLPVAGALIVLPVFLVYFTLLINKPQLGLYFAIGFGFVILGLTRYITFPFPIGLLMDATLLLTFFALFVQKFSTRVDFKPANKDITWLSIIWLAYLLIQVANPEARSIEAWFASFRPMGLYTLLFVVLTLLFIQTPERLKTIFLIWGIFSILATIKGIIQLYIGVDPFEKAWLDGGGSLTHILFGKLRIFSFYSDAGQFGANQGYTGVVFSILAFATKNRRQKIFYIIVALLGFYGMLISGTRGAIAVPFAGFALYIVHRKNLAIMMTGFIFALIIFAFFKFTSIGNGVYMINRMRTAFNPEDASLMVRLENQRKLSVYMATRPIGGGLGHGGIKAQKYLPNALLSNIATDSWYVLIWVELGIVGLIMHLFIQFYILIKGSYYLMFQLRDPVLISQASAFTAGMMGIMLASYANAVIGQYPTSPLIYIGMAIILSTPTIDKNIRVKKRKESFARKYRKSILQN
ncbi:MAG: O-antigen ligase family protein [Bacteroidales bacterium]|nr:O-antigen ligase family protein [Bacteroidales bacterium]